MGFCSVLFPKKDLVLSALVELTPAKPFRQRELDAVKYCIGLVDKQIKLEIVVFELY